MPSDGEVTSTPELDSSRSTKTRAEVEAELHLARTGGRTPDAKEVTPTPEIDEAKSTKTREQVLEELDDYVKSGQRDRDRGDTQAGG
jgi:hypothetical protein